MRGTSRVLGFAAVLAAVLGWPGTAAAHATVALTVNTDGRGSVSVDVAWSDGHPVTEPMAATMTAVPTTATGAAGVGPVALTRLPGRPTVVYSGTLPAGEWRVTVDTALPGIGHCEALVRVNPAGAPASTRCGVTASATAPAATATAPDRSRALLLAAAAVAAVASAGGVLLAIRRRSRRRT
ncbi:hypothetical protein [Micromonospora sp. CPCC 206061]|uniref:hypothetical protein n=1 Tax=Micromonospora sp. CPCC 206061 TaxID=3122410 RepID=UPI002FF1EF43